MNAKRQNDIEDQLRDALNRPRPAPAAPEEQDRSDWPEGQEETDGRSVVRAEPTTAEDVVGAQVNVVIDKTTADACKEIAAFKREVDEMEQLLLTNSSRIKDEVSANIKFGRAVATETRELRDRIDEMREEFNLPRSLRVVS